jgi:PadR family transcriptional regulator PadR
MWLFRHYEDIGNASQRRIVQIEEQKMINNQPKEIQTKLAKGLLDMIVLQFLEQQPMHGYQVITKIRKSFGVYFGPSTIYPLLNTLEKKGYVKSQWDMHAERPRKVYGLTREGKDVLNFTEGSLNLICKTISSQNKVGIETSPLQAKRSELLFGIHAR